MSPYARTLLFCLALLVAPGVYALGETLAGDLAGAALATALVAASMAYAKMGPPLPEWSSRTPEPRTEARLDPTRAEQPAAHLVDAGPILEGRVAPAGHAEGLAPWPLHDRRMRASERR